MRYDTSFKIGNNEIIVGTPTFFVADIAANHDGNLQRAKDLIRLAKDAGAEAAKFQHFKAERIVSDYGFRALGGQFLIKRNGASRSSRSMPIAASTAIGMKSSPRPHATSAFIL